LIKSTVTPDKNNPYFHNRITRTFFFIVNSPIFNAFIILIIVLNTIVLAMDKYPAWEERIDDVFDVANLFFSIIFTIECVFKLIGLGISGFVEDRFNIFDAMIVLVSLFEMFVPNEP